MLNPYLMFHKLKIHPEHLKTLQIVPSAILHSSMREAKIFLNNNHQEHQYFLHVRQSGS